MSDAKKRHTSRRRSIRPSTAPNIDRSVDSTSFFNRIVEGNEDYRDDRYVDDDSTVTGEHSEESLEERRLNRGEGFSQYYWTMHRPPHYGE